MKQVTLCFTGVLLSLIACCSLKAEEVFVEESCTKEELLRFFPEPIVKKVLIEAKLPEKQAVSISKELAIQDEQLRKLVENRAALKEPNPLNDPMQRGQAIKLYQEVLFEVFSTTLKKYGVEEKEQMHYLLEQIRSKKSQLFIDCIRRQQQPANSS